MTKKKVDDIDSCVRLAVVVVVIIIIPSVESTLAADAITIDAILQSVVVLHKM